MVTVEDARAQLEARLAAIEDNRRRVGPPPAQHAETCQTDRAATRVYRAQRQSSMTVPVLGSLYRPNLQVPNRQSPEHWNLWVSLSISNLQSFCGDGSGLPPSVGLHTQSK
jgi:hypothetical protein